MKTIGIIAEYDPFHNGHRYQLNKAKELTGADTTVVVMSGHFLQRGMPSLFSKADRVKMAVEGGADLVLELPFLFAANSSREFARGGVEILEGLGCIDALCFGAETAEPELLRRAAELTDEKNDAFRAFVQEQKRQGKAYPEAAAAAAASLAGSGTAELLRQPNNLLAIEYLKALRHCHSHIQPVPIARIGAEHNSEALPEKCTFASGTAIRKCFLSGGADSIVGLVPESTLDIAGKFSDASLRQTQMEQRMFALLSYRVQTSSAEELSAVYGVDEGLENRLKKEILEVTSLAGLESAVRSRRYTKARIQRMLLHILMNVKRRAFDELRDVTYARVLGFSAQGRSLLRRASETASIPVFSNLSRLTLKDEKVVRCLQYEERAAALTRLLRGEPCTQNSERKYIPYRKS